MESEGAVDEYIRTVSLQLVLFYWTFHLLALLSCYFERAAFLLLSQNVLPNTRPREL